MNIDQVKICFLLILITGTVSAQKFNGGVLAGLSTSEISGDRLEGPNKAGVYAGFFVNRYFSNRSSFQMELDFIQKGSRKNPDSLDFSTYLLRLNYIEIPVHYKYDFHKRGTLEAGLGTGVLIYNYEEANELEVPDSREFKRIDLSFNIGGYFRITGNLLFNLRYSNSILAVRPHSKGQIYRWNKGQYNEVLSFTFHYIISGLSR
ncbi:MAG: PorT family protein [Bacteroidetes bacterium]|nr:PorT family protein [Bacteroidota bacterium]